MAKEEIFLECRDEWTTHSAAAEAAFREYIPTERFEMLKRAGWVIRARKIGSRWGLWLELE